MPTLFDCFLKVADCLCLPVARLSDEREDDKEQERQHTEPQLEVKPPHRGKGRMTKAEYQEIVEAATPEDQWFTPRCGWPRVGYAGGRPLSLMPSLRPKKREGLACKEDFFLPLGMALGELRVELLETDGLPSMDMMFDASDVYAVVVFEDSIARTQTIPNVDNPRWHAECARAFRFPIFAPHSPVHIALFDSDEDDALNLIDHASKLIDEVDRGADSLLDRVSGRGTSSASANYRTSSAVSENGQGVLKGDDPIGRCVLDLRALYPDTEYCCWIELRTSDALDDTGTRGAVRVRYSVSWTAAECRRLVAYLRPPPTFVIPVTGSMQMQHAAEFALRGANHSCFS